MIAGVEDSVRLYQSRLRQHNGADRGRRFTDTVCRSGWRAGRHDRCGSFSRPYREDLCSKTWMSGQDLHGKNRDESSGLRQKRVEDNHIKRGHCRIQFVFTADRPPHFDDAEECSTYSIGQLISVPNIVGNKIRSDKKIHQTIRQSEFL